MQSAQLNGDSDAEIENVVHYAKSSAYGSIYINGLRKSYQVKSPDFVSEREFLSYNIREMSDEDPVRDQ
jgi:hypothetical protein